MASSGNTYAGSCHCGAIVFNYRTDQAPPGWSVRACQCSYCRAHAALSTSDPAGQVEFRQLADGAMHRYRFGQRITDFLVCGECGVYVGAVMEATGGQFGIINVNALRPIPAGLAAPVPMNYGSESAEQRRARRVARWTPVASAATPAFTPGHICSTPGTY